MAYLDTIESTFQILLEIENDLILLLQLRQSYEE